MFQCAASEAAADARIVWREPIEDVDTRVAYTDDELVAFHREVFTYARARRSHEEEAQRFADWSLDQIRAGEYPESKHLWARFFRSKEVAHSPEELEQLAERRRGEFLRAAGRLGLCEFAEDIAQEALRHEQEKGFRPTFYAAIDAARSLGLSPKRGRKEPTRFRPAEEVEGLILQSVEIPDGGVERAAFHRDLNRILAALSRDERSLLLLRFRWGLAQIEIAEMWGVTESRISQMMKAAIERARRIAQGKRLSFQTRQLDPLPRKKESTRGEKKMIEEREDETVSQAPTVVELPTIEDDVPLQPRLKPRNPVVVFLLEKLSVGKSVVLPDDDAKRFHAAAKVNKWRVATRKVVDKPGYTRVWRLEPEPPTDGSLS